MKRWQFYILIAVGVASFAAATAYFVFIAPGRRIKANEAAAISALRTLVSAQALYITRTGRYGDYFNLWDGKEKKYIDERIAKADPDYPEHVCLADHYFDISVNADGTDWCCIARPAEWGIDGKRNFKIGCDGVIYVNETENGTRFSVTPEFHRKLKAWQEKNKDK